MAASIFVGRVGGLAVALGVGAAAFAGSAVAWADTPAAGSDTPSAGQATAATSPSSRQARGAASSKPTPHRSGTPSTSAVRPRAATAVGAVGRAVESAPTLVAEPTPAADIVTALAESPADNRANGNPAVPAYSPLEMTALAYARRGTAAAKSAAAGPAAAISVAVGPAAAISVAAGPSAAATLPLVLGPSGVPIPTQKYVDTVVKWYVTPNSPDGATPAQVVFTPEGLYPITGVKSLPLNTSVDQGMKILSDTLGLLPGGTPTTVFGYSQSAIIGSLLEMGYISPTSPYKDPSPAIPTELYDSISFVFVGNEMNPNGGFLSRFPNLLLPSLGIPFYGATPEDAYPTTNYTREYDGFADFPRYPLNLLSVLNAGLGIIFVHTKYAPADTCQTFCLTEQEVQAALPLPSTSATQKYYFMPTENLPLVEPLRLIPLIGNPIADLIQPVLKVLVNLGYGDPAHGFTSATQPDANVQVPFGLFPEVSPVEVLGQLLAGVQQGITDFFAALGPGGSLVRELSSISLPSLSFSPPTAEALIPAIQQAVTAVADRISYSIAGLYAALLPTADIINAIVVSLPAYSLNLALDGVQQILSGDLIGGLINAVGLPIAANVGLITTASLIGVLVWAQAAVAVLFPNYIIGT